jgi:hypothetical protein
VKKHQPRPRKPKKRLKKPHQGLFNLAVPEETERELARWRAARLRLSPEDREAYEALEPDDDSPNAQRLNALVEQYENEISAAEIETQLRILLGLPG